MRHSNFFKILVVTLQIMALSLIQLPNSTPIRAITGFTVTYDGNGSTSGVAPIDSTLYSEGNEISIYDNTQNLQKDGLVFVGWTKIADGNEIIKPGDILIMETSDVVLFAKWEPAIIVNYDFDNQLIDTLGNSVLTPFGTTTDGYARNNATSGFGNDDDGSYWYWTSTLSRGGGFKIDIDENISSSYTIGVRFAFNSTGSGYRKIIDYKNSASDTGFYFLGGRLNFYPHGTGSTNVANNQVVDIIATRKSDGLFTAYFVINGTLYKELELNAGNDAIPAIVDGKVRFGFFFDDTRTGSEATNGGKVYSVRVWNGPISSVQAETAMEPTYTVSFDTDSDITISSQTIKKDENASKPEDPTKDHHSFLGWHYHNGDEWVAYDFDTPVTANVELKALWEINQYTVRFIDYDDSLLSESMVNHGSDAVAPEDPTKDHHSFLGWHYHNDDEWVAYDFDTPVTANVELKALWEINQYTVRFIDYDDSLLSESMVNHGSDAVAPEDPTRIDWKFTGWNSSFKSVTSSRTIQATYKSIVQTIIEDNDENGLDVEAPNLNQVISFNEDELDEFTRIILNVNLINFQELTQAEIDLFEDYYATLGSDLSIQLHLLDISLFKEVGETLTLVEETIEPLFIRFNIPEFLHGKEFSLVRIHLGILEELEYRIDEGKNVIEFSTDKFSTYALVLGESSTIPETNDQNSYIWAYLLVGLILLMISKSNSLKSYKNK